MLAKSTTNTSCAIWWPHWQAIQIAPSVGQNKNLCKGCHPETTKKYKKKGPKSTKMFGNVPESTKMYQEGPKKCQKKY